MERTWKPTVAGVLDIIAGAYGLIGGTILLVLGGVIVASIAQAGGGSGPDMGRILTTGLFQALGWSHIVGGLLAIVGGILNFQRRNWTAAIIFNVAAVIASFTLGLPALILTAMSEKEFARGSAAS